MSRHSNVCTWMLLLFAVGCGAADHEEHDEHEEDGEQALAHEVSIAPEAVRGLGIEVGVARAGTDVALGTIPAELELDPTRVAHVSTLVSGRVVRLDVGVGARVEAGATLASLASTAATEIGAASAQARARTDAARATLERLRALRESGVAAQRSLLDAETELSRAEAELAGLGRQRGVVGAAAGTVRLVAPIAGEVIEVRAHLGQTLAPGETAIVVADVSRVWAVGHAPEMLVPWISEGRLARLRLFAWGAERWEAPLAYVAPVLDPDTHTLAVRMELDGSDGRARPGMLGAIELAEADDPTRVVIPRDAVSSVHGADVVFRPAEAEGTYEVVPVAVAARDMDEVVIASGLSVGDRVVTRGAFVLSSQLLAAELEGGHAH